MRKLILVFTVLLPLLCANAQENSQQENKKAAVNTTWKANRFQDNWFISVDGGIADLMSEESRYTKFGDRIKPTVGISVGKWMSPVWGLRLNVTGAELQGFATWTNNLGLGSWYIGTNGAYPGQGTTNTYLPVYADVNYSNFVKDRFLGDARTTSKGAGYDYTLKYVGGSIDFMWNINNTFRPYNEKRFFEVILFGGPAYTHTFKEGVDIAGGEYERTAVNSIGVKAGLQTKFRLSNAWDFHLEGQTYVLPESFDRRVGDGNTMDGILNVFAGFTYKFNKRNFTQPEPIYIDRRPIEPAPAPKDDCCDELRESLKKIDELLNRKPETIVKEKMKIAVYFAIDKHEVRTSEMYKLDEIAAFMKKYPQVKVSISGYADVKTGNPSYNQKLSERRCNEVVRLLTSKYNVASERFTVKAFGDTVQPFNVNELNRAVIAFDIE